MSINFFYFSGYLREKTCILITHQLQYLTKVDQIILMENVSVIMNIICILPLIINIYTLSKLAQNMG